MLRTIAAIAFISYTLMSLLLAYLIGIFWQNPSLLFQHHPFVPKGIEFYVSGIAFYAALLGLVCTLFALLICIYRFIKRIRVRVTNP